MRESCTDRLLPSTSTGAIHCTFIESPLPRILRVVRSLHPKGTARWLHRATGRSLRTCKYWLAGEVAMGGDAALKIVRKLRVEIDAHSEQLRQFELDLQ